MNAQLMDQARAAYRAGDFSSAAQLFASAKTADEICGEADHLRGNSLMRLGLFQDAAEAYSAALRDASYGKSGALLTNQGKALAAAGDLAGAANSFGLAVQDSSYATPYKAYMGLGNALLKSGNPTDAGVAFRSAAIDGANPAPAAALMNLGDCSFLVPKMQSRPTAPHLTSSGLTMIRALSTPASARRLLPPVVTLMLSRHLAAPLQTVSINLRPSSSSRSPRRRTPCPPSAPWLLPFRRPPAPMLPASTRSIRWDSPATLFPILPIPVSSPFRSLR